MIYGCFGYGMYIGNIFLNWSISVLIVVGLILLVVWLVKKIQNEDRNERKYKISSQTRNAFERRSNKQR